jgi:hypothetical protein
MMRKSKEQYEVNISYRFAASENLDDGDVDSSRARKVLERMLKLQLQNVSLIMN